MSLTSNIHFIATYCNRPNVKCPSSV